MCLTSPACFCHQSPPLSLLCQHLIQQGPTEANSTRSCRSRGPTPPGAGPTHLGPAGAGALHLQEQGPHTFRSRAPTPGPCRSRGPTPSGARPTHLGPAGAEAPHLGLAGAGAPTLGPKGAGAQQLSPAGGEAPHQLIHMVACQGQG